METGSDESLVGISVWSGMVAIVVSAVSLSSVTLAKKQHKLSRMIELIKLSDPVLLQMLSDALEEHEIFFRIDNAGMNALMPLPTVMDARVLVAEDGIESAKQILTELELSQ